MFLWVRFVGHGAASGAPLEMELAHVYTLKAGRCVEYMDRAEALKAVGLRGVAMSQENIGALIARASSST